MSKFCPHCGEPAHDRNAVICPNTGLPLRKIPAVNSQQKNKIAAGFLAFFLGRLGVHKFYHGSWGWGIVYLAANALAFLMTGTLIEEATRTGQDPGEMAVGCFVIFHLPFAIILLVESIYYWCMSQEKYDEKYNNTPSHPFKW
ncbi:MAG: TM2 domain-containing protein [Planctomycetaceae bacterium]|jgi:hypothetical protein|nr:TM2 domain-containing protein [Planctomycetaceae bacterium]